MVTQAARRYLISLGLLGCGGAEASPPPEPAGELVRSEADATVDAGGISEELVFELPLAPRSFTVVAEGDTAALYALASLVTADGVEHVGIDLDEPPGSLMSESYYDEEIGLMSGDLHQQIRLGTFTHAFPYAPGQTFPPGEVRLRVASDTPGPVHVTFIVPPEDDGRVLHVNLIVASETVELEEPLSFFDDAQGLMRQADIELVVDEIVHLRETGLNEITEFVEPQENSTTQAAGLPSLVPDGVSPRALDLFVVDALPNNVTGLSLGTPGPPLRGSYYYGVVVAHTSDDDALGRVVAHEIAHFLGLHHVTNTGVSGVVYRDPLGDTTPGSGNLMDRAGTLITADQAYVLRRSPLLVR